MNETKDLTFSIKELAELTNSQLIGNPEFRVSNVADLETATSEDVSFLGNPRYENAMKQSSAGVIFIPPHIKVLEGRNFLINEDPSNAFQKTIEAFYAKKGIETSFQGIHPTALVHKSVKLGSNVTIAPYSVIDRNVTIGSNTFIGPHCSIGAFCSIGENCYFHPHVIIRENCVIGNRVILQPGAVIGSCGYGYVQDKKGRHIKLNQVGNVVLEDDVEIGANTTIDRARFKSTRIGRGTKIDNLVIIGHNVRVGEDNIIIGQTGIAGSTETGNHVIIAGQVGVAGHIKLDSGVVVAAKSGVSKSLSAGKYNGIPAMPLQEYNRLQIYIRNLEKYVKKIEELQSKIENSQ